MVSNTYFQIRELGAELPDDATIVGISTKPVFEFCQELSIPLQEVIPRAAKIVMDLLIQIITNR